ncbi:GTPase [Nocardiopsis sp. LOL_012]|uniref:GTPase n=1 Tax=Nocardiopsis sp. LOL_012 TaxID=3345409 RepID=UPI003A83D77D
MTTQWNPERVPGVPGADEAGDGASPAGTDAVADRSGGAPDGEPLATQSDPWRGYTVPVPDAPGHTPQPGSVEGSGDPVPDGIAGYPDAGTDWAAGSGGPPPGRRGGAGRHARPSAREEAARSRDDDPDGLAGWVGSLAEAAEDSQIAGRTTGTLPAVVPGGPEWVPAPEPEDSADGGEGPEPLPQRVPGSSPMSGSFRAVDSQETGSAAGADSAADATEEDEDEYRPTQHDTWHPDRTITRDQLVERLDALTTMTELGREDLPGDLVARATQLLDHAGARLRLSGDHTVVALAGGTGSGKSSLFNALCGLELSQIGVTRPTTSKAHACVWGHEGADALLSWLGVPTRYRHSRTGVLDSGSSELTGLVLLDLPDHDSVRSMHTAEADRLIGSVDLLVWVLDPQKYADAAVHHRYLARMAGHGAVTVAVLNQVDKVQPDELEELLTDLRRLMETEAGVHPRVITTSTLTGKGISDLREFLGDTVRERRALVDRLAADLELVMEEFEEFRGEGEIPEAVPEEVDKRISSGLVRAAGVGAVADVAETNIVKRGRREVGWPLGGALAKVRKDPLASVQLDFLRGEGGDGVTGPVDAQSAELERVLGDAADGVSEGMPAPWRRRMRAAALSGASELPGELGGAVAGTVADPDRDPSWWKAAKAVQYGLLGVSALGLVWALVAGLNWFGEFTGLAVLDTPFIVYGGALAVAPLLVGWLTGVGCGNLVEVSAVQRREQVEQEAVERVRRIARRRATEPMDAELERYRMFRSAYEVARSSS